MIDQTLPIAQVRPYRILVWGGEDYSDKESIWNLLDSLHRSSCISVIIQGGGPGAETLAQQWAVRANVQLLTFHPHYDKHPNDALLFRDRLMLAEGKPNAILVFSNWSEKSDLVVRARQAGVWVMNVF